MKVGQVKDLDSLPTRLRRLRICWFWLWKQIRRIQGTRGRRRTKISAERTANVLTIKSGHVRQGKDLCPDGPKSTWRVGILASRIGLKACSLTQRDHSIRYECWRGLSQKFANAERGNTF